jgi:hypothetical protein
MKNFTINSKKYLPAEVDFNFICDLEDMGIEIKDFASKPMAVARAYFALCAKIDIENAGKEIQKHIINGGKLDELYDSLSEAVEKSDFFQALNQTEEPEVAESKGKKK